MKGEKQDVESTIMTEPEEIVPEPPKPPVKKFDPNLLLGE